MTSESTLNALLDRTDGVRLDELFAFFDGLESVKLDEMIGDWEGGVFHTGHPGEGQLALVHWAGKSFRGHNDVDPIVSKDATGRRKANPVLGAACLRAVEYRGVVTATMVYDKHPIFDHFRRISKDRVLGVMDRKGEDTSLFFWLRRLP